MRRSTKISKKNFDAETKRTGLEKCTRLRPSDWPLSVLLFRALEARWLKGQCHEDFAVLDQFWAKIITLRLYSLTKCFCKVTMKISNEFYQRGLTIIKFLRIF